jgi:hypothetical protein
MFVVVTSMYCIALLCCAYMTLVFVATVLPLKASHCVLCYVLRQVTVYVFDSLGYRPLSVGCLLPITAAHYSRELKTSTIL